MTGPQTLTRPLAARVASLPAPVERSDNPPVAPAVIEAAVAALEAGKTHYTDRPGILPLREQAVNWLGQHYGLELSPDAVTITIGATEARYVAVKQLAAPGTSIAAVEARPGIAGAAALIGVPLVTDINKLDTVSVVYLTPDDPAAARDALLAQAAAHGWWVIWDTSIGEAGAFHPAQAADLAPQVVTLGSLSHDLPGWRMGWMAGSKAANKLRAYKQSMTICSPSISQWAALGLEDGR
ncbi:MAG TPA: pyridoxal phosphate-dependent aminotransferase [Candidatus Limnocylindrales bacterium]|nr:pyridoxal phosphate-dependent aminotransferase [Candidatus Limnocylindrales bacterium]